MKNMKAENICQGDVLKILNPDNELWLELCLCEVYGAEWRKIIDDYTEQHGRTPEAKDLIWITSEHIGEDLRQWVAREIEAHVDG